MVDDLQLGGFEDTVSLRLADQDIRLYQQYEVKCAIFQQPASFSLRLGWNATAAELLTRFPPNTPFELRIGRSTIMSGVTYGRAMPSIDRTEIEIKGRDYLAKLYDDELEFEKKYTEKTYLALTRKILDEAGLKEQAGHFKIFEDNDANRERITQAETKHKRRKVVTVETGASDGQGNLIYQTMEGKVGRRRMDFLLEQFKLVNLFLWSTGNGNFVLGRPQADMAPGYRVSRARGKLREQGDAEACQFNDDVTQRHARYVCFGKSGGKGVRGEFVDEEMKAYGFDHVHVFEDKDAKTKEQAEFLARRACAEERRNGWSLEYELSGHIRPSLANVGKQAVWSYDMTCDVQDEILGLHGPFYIESVTYRRKPFTTTAIKLIRPQDLVWADGLFNQPTKTHPSTKAAPTKNESGISDKTRAALKAFTNAEYARLHEHDNRLLRMPYKDDE